MLASSIYWKERWKCFQEPELELVLLERPSWCMVMLFCFVFYSINHLIDQRPGRDREVKQLVPSDTAGKFQNRDWNPGSLAPQPALGLSQGDDTVRFPLWFRPCPFWCFLTCLLPSPSQHHSCLAVSSAPTLCRRTLGILSRCPHGSCPHWRSLHQISETHYYYSK